MFLCKIYKILIIKIILSTISIKSHIRVNGRSPFQIYVDDTIRQVTCLMNIKLYNKPDLGGLIVKLFCVIYFKTSPLSTFPCLPVPSILEPSMAYNSKIDLTAGL